jgi:DNA-binding transcriptional ArsR family regulator
VLEALRAKPGVPEEVEYRILRPDGAVRCIRDRAFPVRDVSGRVIRIAGLAADVTERRHHVRNLLPRGRGTGRTRAGARPSRGAALPTVRELAEELVMDRSTLGQNLRPLERDGLITLLTLPNLGDRNRAPEK